MSWFSLVVYFSVLTWAYFWLGDLGLLSLNMYGGPLDISWLGMVLVGIFFLSIILPKSINRISEAFNWVIALLLIMPSLAGFMFSAVSSKMIFFSFGLLLLTTLVSKVNYSVVFKKKIRATPQSLALILLFCGIIPILLFGNYSEIEYSVGNLYENREKISNDQFALFEYFHPILSKAVLPFLLIFYIHHKKYRIIAISIYMFFLVQHRAALFYPVLAISGYYSYKNYSRQFGLIVTWSLIVIVCLMILNLFYSHILGVLLPDFILRRSLMVPAILQSVYLDFFAENTFTLFSDSKITFGLVPYPYDRPVPYLIGEFIGLPKAHANAGIVGSGFQQAGFFGVFLYSMLLAFIMLIIDFFTPRDLKSVAFGMTLPAFYWIIASSDILSIFLTHGLIVSLLFILLLGGLKIQVQR